MDVTNRKPGIVTLTFFNNRGEKTQEQVLTDSRLFPEDLKVGEDLVFARKTKQDSSSNLTKALPSLMEN